MQFFSTYLSEFPYILTITLSVYLAFEYWQFPDLTIESSFTSGMVLGFIVLSGSTFSSALLTSVLLILIFSVGYAFTTWLFTLLRMPPLFAGFLVVLAAYSLNFYLNGGSTQSTFLPKQISIAEYLGLSVMEFMILFAFVSALLLAGLIGFFDRSDLGKKVFLSRRIPNRSVAKSLGLNTSLLLLCSMVIYNAVAVFGGFLYASSNSVSHVSFLGAIAPGLAAMFIVKAAREYATLPSKRKLSGQATKLSQLILRNTDSLILTIILLVVLSLLITLVRFWLREFQMGMGMLNAFTALGTFFVWGSIGFVAHYSGKDIRDNANA